jgi:hypothetical protein
MRSAHSLVTIFTSERNGPKTRTGRAEPDRSRTCGRGNQTRAETRAQDNVALKLQIGVNRARMARRAGKSRPKPVS